MADVRLDRPEAQRAVDPLLPIGRQQRLRLDRVAELRTGPVALDRVDISRRQARAGQRRPDDTLLRRTIRRGQAIGRAVLIDRTATDHAENLMPVTPRIRQPLQHQQPKTVGEPGAVGRGRIRLAAPVRRQTTLPGELHQQERLGHHRHAARQGERALAVAQRLRGQVHRDQRGGARGVDRHRRALEPQGVGDPARRRRWRSCRSAGSLRGPASSRRRSPRPPRRRTRRCREPRSDTGSIPAFSNASQDASSSNRCCGSIASASRGPIPKNPASKSPAPARKPPPRV